MLVGGARVDEERTCQRHRFIDPLGAHVFSLDAQLAPVGSLKGHLQALISLKVSLENLEQCHGGPAGDETKGNQLETPNNSVMPNEFSWETTADAMRLSYRYTNAP